MKSSEIDDLSDVGGYHIKCSDTDCPWELDSDDVVIDGFAKEMIDSHNVETGHNDFEMDVYLEIEAMSVTKKIEKSVEIEIQ